MKKYDEQTWLSELNELDNNTSIENLLNVINEKLKSVDKWYITNVLGEALTFILKKHQKSWAEAFVANADWLRCLDIGMLNYKTQYLDHGAFVIYSNIIDMTTAEKDEEYDNFIYTFAINGRRNDVLICIEKGFNINYSFLFLTALKSLNFDDAKFYYENFKFKIKKKEWDNFLADIAYLCWDFDTIKILNECKKYDLNHPIIGYKPLFIMAKACMNGGTHVAEYLYENGSNNLTHKKSKKDPMFLSKAQPKSIKWLLDKGVCPKRHGKEILKVLCHKRGTNDLIKEIIGKMDTKDVPWVEMLCNVVGSEADLCIPKINFLDSIYNYTEEDYKKAYVCSLKYELNDWKHVSEFLKKEHNIKVDGNLILDLLNISSNKGNSSNIIKLLNEVENLSQEEKNKIFEISVKDILCRGGKLDLIKTLLKMNITFNETNKKIIEDIKYREDLKLLIGNL